MKSNVPNMQNGVVKAGEFSYTRKSRTLKAYGEEFAIPVKTVEFGDKLDEIGAELAGAKNTSEVIRVTKKGIALFIGEEATEKLYLALAGYDAEKAVSALPTVLNVAAAGGMELASASDMITDAMSALGLETSQMSTFADQLAVTAQKSNTSVSQLGEAILTVGGTAKTLSGGVEEMNTALGILADNGIKVELQVSYSICTKI